MTKSVVLHEDRDCRELIGRVLVRRGHELVAPAEAQKALGRAGSSRVDIAIVSLHLTGSPCPDWRSFKQSNPGVRILVLTHYTTKAAAIEALAQGADDYLLEPIDIEKLEQKLESLLSTNV
jgi:two-component system response regulator RegA